MKNNYNGIITEVVYFWKKLIENPVRFVSVLAFLAIVWLDAGWIFHPIHSVVSLVGTAVIIVGISAFIAGRGYLNKIKWNNHVHQSVATRCTVGFTILIILYNFLGSNVILFTIIAAVIVAIAIGRLFFRK